MKLSEIVGVTREGADAVMYWDIEEDLKKGGWKRYAQGEKFWLKHREKGEHVSVWIKSYSGVSIEAILKERTWALLLMVTPSFKASQRIPDDLKKQHEEELFETLNVRKQWNISTLEATAKKMADLVKKLRAPRPKKDYRGFRYNQKEGEEALKEWLKDAEEIIIKELKSSKKWGDNLVQQSQDAWGLTENILKNYGRDPGFLHKKHAYQQVVNILRRLKKKGLVDELPASETGKKKTLWVWEGPVE